MPREGIAGIRTQFVEAIKANDTDQLKALIKKHTNPARGNHVLNRVLNTSRHWAPVYVAADKYKWECLRILLEMDIQHDVNVLNRSFQEVLQMGQVEFVDLLLKCGADPNHPCARGYRPIDTPIAKIHHSDPTDRYYQCFLLLLRAGADPNGMNDIDIPYPYQKLPLAKAIVRGLPECVEGLINYGADTSVLIPVRDTPEGLTLEAYAQKYAGTIFPPAFVAILNILQCDHSQYSSV